MSSLSLLCGAIFFKYMFCENPLNFIPIICLTVNGGWSLWGSWGACSVSCAAGTHQRVRPCSNPAPAYGGLGCTGDGSSSGSCDEGPCPSKCCIIVIMIVITQYYTCLYIYIYIYIYIQ